MWKHCSSCRMWKHHCIWKRLEVSLLGSSLSSSLEIILSTELLSGCMQETAVDSTICSPCRRDANTASILTPCWIIGQQTIVEYTQWRTDEWCTYVHWRIYSSRYLDTLLYKLELNMHWKNVGLYTIATMEEKGWDCSQMYNWHCSMNRITMKWEPVNLGANVWIAIPLFDALMPLGGVNGNLYWHFSHQTAEETIECHSCN